MKYFSICSLLFILCACANKKNLLINDSQTEGVDLLAMETLDFPDNWIGRYEGLLEIFNTKGKVMEIPMVLQIDSLNNQDYYPWLLQYGEDDLRDYGLLIEDSLKGHYIIDEFNGILIDAYAMQNTLVSHFSVANSEITSIYKKEGELIEFQIISSVSDTLTNSRAMEGENIYEVGSFPVNAYQKAILRKK
jgi:hypothetical protein